MTIHVIHRIVMAIRIKLLHVVDVVVTEKQVNGVVEVEQVHVHHVMEKEHTLVQEVRHRHRSVLFVAVAALAQELHMKQT